MERNEIKLIVSRTVVYLILLIPLCLNVVAIIVTPEKTSLYIVLCLLILLITSVVIGIIKRERNKRKRKSIVIRKRLKNIIENDNNELKTLKEK